LEAVIAANMVLDRYPEYSVIEPVTYGGFNLRGPSQVCMSIQ
jgi:hypothetical protein